MRDSEELLDPPGTPGCSGLDPRMFTDGDTFADPAVARAALAVCAACPVWSWCAESMSAHSKDADLIFAGTIVRHGRTTSMEQLEASWRVVLERRRRRSA